MEITLLGTGCPSVHTERYGPAQVVRHGGLPELDPQDRHNVQIWRVELRAGKKHLKERWGITTWTDLHDKLGDLFLRSARDIRLTQPSGDSNRSRWSNAPIWELVVRELQADLFELVSQADPGVVKEVIRKQHCDMLMQQIGGLSASWGTASGFESEQVHDVMKEVAESLRRVSVNDPQAFIRKMERAAERYVFL